MNKSVNIISLGCAKNLVDSEILLGGLNKSELIVTDNPEDADTIIVNTCGFLDIAREESVDTILQAAELKIASGSRIDPDGIPMIHRGKRYAHLSKIEDILAPEHDRLRLDNLVETRGREIPGPCSLGI